MIFKQAKLSNGLTIIAETDDHAHTAAVGFFVRAGARDEDHTIMGVSHFLEHMMFKGTERRTADDVNREFDELGANYNAFTSHEQTAYYAHVLPEMLPRAVDLLGDMLRPSLREDDFSMEKNVILEEIGMYDDRPEWRLQDQLLEDHFGKHPLGHRVLGTTDSIKALTAGQMREYFEHRYSPDNIVVAAAGKVDFESLCKDVETLCGHWQPTGAKRDGALPELSTKDRTIRDSKANRCYLAMVTPAPSANDTDRYAMKVISDVLGDSEGSRLYWALVDPGIADEADFAYMSMDGLGVAYAFATCDPERSEQVEQVMRDTLKTAFDGFEPDEVERTKNKLATIGTLQGERPLGRMQTIGRQWDYLGRYISLDEDLQAIQSVTIPDMERVLNAYPFDPCTTVRLMPA